MFELIDTCCLTSVCRAHIYIKNDQKNSFHYKWQRANVVLPKVMAIWLQPQCWPFYPFKPAAFFTWSQWKGLLIQPASWHYCRDPHLEWPLRRKEWKKLEDEKWPFHASNVLERISLPFDPWWPSRLAGLWQGQWRLCESSVKSLDRPKGTALRESEEWQQTCLAPSITSSGLRHGVAGHFHDGGRSHAPRPFFCRFPRAHTEMWL